MPVLNFVLNASVSPKCKHPPRQTTGKFFEVVKSPSPGQNFSAKVQPSGQENTYHRYSPLQRFPKRKRGKGGGKGRLGERGRKEEETSDIKPFQDGRRQGVGANFRTT